MNAAQPPGSHGNRIMTTSPHQIQCIGLILLEHFGETVQNVALTLLLRGRSTLSQAALASGLSLKATREALFILIQHSLVSYTEAAEALRIVVYYSVNPLSILLRDRIPLYASVANERFGPMAKDLVACIAMHGKCTFAHMIASKNLVDKDQEQVEDAFNDLVSQSFVVQVSDDDSLCQADRKISEEDAEIAKNPHMTATEKTKLKKLLEQRNKGAEFEDMPTGSKRKLVYSFQDDENKAAKMYDETEANMAESAYWRLNPSRFHLHCRNVVRSFRLVMKYTHYCETEKALTEIAEARINLSAKEVMRVILDFAEPSMTHCKADQVSVPITLSHLASRIDQTKITFYPSSARASLTDYVALLTQDHEFPLLVKQDDRGGGQFVANLQAITTCMREQLVINYVKERHGIVGARIWKLLKTKGMLGEKEVAKLALISNKVARERLYRLHQSGMIFLQVESMRALFNHVVKLALGRSENCGPCAK
ncbi:DNA-directed RNA polymerase III subunit RPC3 [Entophlyctis sp. JEL0112]|nr:DNA-directed RNA polymerase III subunit RPC3 [Entophlyctis sp. JEL0112]